MSAATVGSGSLARRGYVDPDAARRALAEPALASALGRWGTPPARVARARPGGHRPGGRRRGASPPGQTLGTQEAAEELLGLLAAAADPDAALRAVARLAEDGSSPALALLAEPGDARGRLVAVLGASTALADGLVRHPGDVEVLREPDVRVEPQVLRAEMLRAVGADPGAAPPGGTSDGGPVAAAEATGDDLRRAYRRRLLSLAGRDLAAPDPERRVGDVGRELADLAAAALEGALALARRDVGEEACAARLAVIGMGKCGGRELNYVSDVDVVYVVEPAEGASERQALAVGTRLARLTASHCSAFTTEGTLWPVDAALRPEGNAGPLVRTVESHRAYYERWASTWEFQALLKARHVAGDAHVAQAYLDAVRPGIWTAAQRPGFVGDTQAMRRRIEEHVPAKDAARELKRGPGGLRDVEFSVQLLQLVHGRADEHLRSGTTLDALEALAAYGYVGRADAGHLDRAYRWLRVVEHRLQLACLTRTHVVPRGAAELRRLARAARAGGVEGLEQRCAETRSTVRRLHERLFYRPLLEAAARLSTEDVRLSPEAARARLAALGYRDPAGALRHLEALSGGVSRRAAIQRQLLPVLLGWFAEGPDPDGGLLSFRRLSESLGGTHWYLQMLRDDGVAAERLAALLAGSAMAADLLLQAPEAARWLDGDVELRPRPPEQLRAEVFSVVARHRDPVEAVTAARSVRRREVTRTAVADICGLLTLDEVGSALSTATRAVLQGALSAALRSVAARLGEPLPVRMAVIGMGRLGGGEATYSSDADVLFVHEPRDGAPEARAQEVAVAVAGEVQRLLTALGPEPPLAVDAALRPEGRSGPLSRSLSSFASYYARWSHVWEAQALLRAEPVAGDVELGQAFCALVEGVRYPAGGLDDAQVREIRRVKARVEAERLPRGVDPRRHVKLGPGGIADVEWTVQVLQLQHAHRQRGLRTTSTLQALGAAVGAGLVTPADAAVLEGAWRWSSRVRAALALWTGKPADVLPTDLDDLEGVARLMGMPTGSAGAVEDEHRRRTRHARAVVERLLFGWDER
ncbi:bifunctional [glutamine synthetase] adenylyltransferase/[glutamine synthetase]-adenylyl-L-tyrosine phosphorylase [Pseudokineococcus sp. 1T1Z-3]|uniref:bifunctional [glutamine synthetase] adenylyltransferase/[glutamine synthetase]-adenylyl-L-tyrosine phosphorylase n=1 Tax=Pseudokineococcus sp. 1T1Z-3 TaxID=3132745 RepID=UPI0030AFF51F